MIEIINGEQSSCSDIPVNAGLSENEREIGPVHSDLYFQSASIFFYFDRRRGTKILIEREREIINRYKAGSDILINVGPILIGLYLQSMGIVLLSFVREEPKKDKESGIERQRIMKAIFLKNISGGSNRQPPPGY